MFHVKQLERKGKNMDILEKIKNRPWIEYVDDEREIDNGVIVKLKDDYYFIDGGCGVRGFDNPTEVYLNTRKKDIYYK